MSRTQTKAAQVRRGIEIRLAKPAAKGPKFVARVRCAVGHSGNTRIYLALRWGQCAGCRTTWSRVILAEQQRGPVRLDTDRQLRTVREYRP